MSFRLNLDEDQVLHVNAPMPVCVQIDRPTFEVIEVMQENDSGNVVVCDGNQPVGIFTERDALKMMARGDSFDIPIEKVMTANPTTLTSKATLGDAIKTMSEGGYRRLPIVNEEGDLVSMLKVSQILRYLVEHFPQYIYNLPPAPHHTLTEREGA